MTRIADKPWFTSVPMRCRACRNDYTGWIIAGCSLAMAASYMRAMACPLCGSGASYQAIVTEPGQQP